MAMYITQVLEGIGKAVKVSVSWQCVKAQALEGIGTAVKVSVSRQCV